MWLEGMDESQKRSHDPYPTSAWSLLNGETHRTKLQSSLGRHSRCSYFNLHFSERLSTGRLGTHVEDNLKHTFSQAETEDGHVSLAYIQAVRFGFLWHTKTALVDLGRGSFLRASQRLCGCKQAGCNSCMCCKMPCLLPPNQSKQC